MNLNFDALKGVELVPIEKKTPVRTGRIAVPNDDVSIRVFANGTAYPSKAFAEKYKLEYLNKGLLGSFGLDIFTSTNWKMLKNQEQVFLFCAAVPKRTPKVDMWGQTAYDEDGSPKSSVFNQGGGTFASNSLLPMIAEVFQIDWKETAYVDMVMMEDIVVKSPNDIYYIPKTVSRGEDRGKVTYAKREKITVCPLNVVHIEMKPVSPDVAEATFGAAGNSDLLEKTGSEKVSEDVDEVPAPTDEVPAPTVEVVVEDSQDTAEKVEPNTNIGDENPFII